MAPSPIFCKRRKSSRSRPFGPKVGKMEEALDSLRAVRAAPDDALSTTRVEWISCLSRAPSPMPLSPGGGKGAPAVGRESSLANARFVSFSILVPVGGAFAEGVSGCELSSCIETSNLRITSHADEAALVSSRWPPPARSATARAATGRLEAFRNQEWGRILLHGMTLQSESMRPRPFLSGPLYRTNFRNIA